MNPVRGRSWLVIPVLLVLLAGCGGSSATTSPASGAAFPNSAAAATTAPAAAAIEVPAAAGGAAPVDESQANTSANSPAPQIVTDPNRKIIKDATFIIEVENVAIALTQIGNTAAQSGGYVLETRTETSADNRPAGFVKIAVPVDQFEATLQRVRESAISVLSEQASGQDVTQEFVDTQSQLANLEATQARIREFLAQATTVEESLKVNAQLSEIEGQISELKGRSQFLSGRAAYSTITVQMQLPPLPLVTPTPIPTPTPVVVPGWSASSTAGSAWEVFVNIARAIATVLIWLTVVVGPFLLPLGLIWLLWRAYRRRVVARQSPPRNINSQP